MIKMGRFGKFLACPGFPDCKNAKPLVERMPGRCPKCGSGMLKRKSKKGYAYYSCEQGASCGFMSWDVPTAEDCPKCGQTMFKKSGRGRMKPFCINESCENFLPEDKREAAIGVLSHDPRPSYQRNPDRVYGLTFAGYDIRFCVKEDILTVTAVEKV